MTTWLETYVGNRFHFFNIIAASIDIRDIAHALSLMCRFCGHTSQFVSIGVHSINVMALVSDKSKLAALLHDSAEAYIGDISRPLKASLPEINLIEKDIRDAIFNKFNVVGYDEAEIQKADDIMLATEAKHFMTHWEEWGLKEQPIELSRELLYDWQAPAIEKIFLQKFNELSLDKHKILL